MKMRCLFAVFYCLIEGKEVDPGDDVTIESGEN